VCEDTYLPSQFNYIIYMASSGGLSVPESDQRQDYYNVGGIPDLYFDGYEHIVGAGSGAVDGHEYFPVIEDHWNNTTPVAVRVTGFSFTPGSAYANIEVEIIGGNLASIANTYVRVALVESGLVDSGHTFDHVLRDMVPNLTGTPLTVQNAGQIQTLELPFTMGAWNGNNMQVIAWVQRDSDKFIYNSGNSRVVPFAANVAVAGAQQAVLTGEPLDFGTTTIANVGLQDDVYDITLDTSALPSGWDAYFTYNGVETTSVSVPVASFATANLFVTIDANTYENSHVTLNIYSQGGAVDVASIDFVTVPGNRQVLLVADDGGAGYTGTYFEPAITAAGKTFAVWDRSLTTIDAVAMAEFDAVVWACGNTNPSLEPDDTAAITAYLAGGGKLMLTGQDVAEWLYANGGTSWFQTTTHIRMRGGNSGSRDVNGVVGDPITDGLTISLIGGDGADNQPDPDWFQSIYADAIPIFNYANARLAGSRLEVGNSKLVFFGFGFEGINSQSTRNTLMTNVLTYLVPGGSTPVQDTPRVLTLAQNTPNPFNPLTKIAFALDRNGPVRLAVYDLQGRLVRNLVSEPMTAGEHTLVWDGRDDANQQAASGTYVYRLTADGTTLSRKMTLVK